MVNQHYPYVKVYRGLLPVLISDDHEIVDVLHGVRWEANLLLLMWSVIIGMFVLPSLRVVISLPVEM